MIKVELIAVAGCSKCIDKRDKLKSAAKAAAKGQLVWREVDVLDEIDYVVGLGVLTLPAVAINGKLVFKSLPSIPEIKREIRKHLPGATA
jgi:hypothetical protein